MTDAPLFDQIIQQLDRSGVPNNKFPTPGGEYWAHCPMPHHQDADASFSINEERGYHCFGCQAEGSVRDLAEIMGLVVPEDEPGDDSRRVPPGCTLQAYADAKRLPVGFLKSLGLDEVRERRGQGEITVLHIPYRDESGATVAIRRRQRLAKKKRGADDRFLWRKGDQRHLYGLWRLAEMKAKGWVLLVEGESDCHTAWLYDVPALGIPGATNWKNDWAAYLDGVEVYAWHEPDQGGDTFIERLRASAPGAKVIVPPVEFKDLSAANILGHDVPGLLDELKKSAKPIGEVQSLAVTAENMAGLETYLRAQLSGKLTREIKLKVANLITGWMLEHDRLVLDTTQDGAQGGRAYMVSDDGALWPLDRQAVTTRLTLYQAGLNGTETIYAFVIEALTMECHRKGRHVALAHWQRTAGDTLYFSCGPCALVRAVDGQALERLPNGADDVWFAGDTCYPAWDVAAPVEPWGLSAFNANLATPHEVQSYTPQVQRMLLSTWFAALASGIRPLPFLIGVGEKGGGKSTLVRAILQTLLPDSDIVAAPRGNDQREFWVQVTTAPLVAYDNIDAELPGWLLDEIAGTITGKAIEQRQLYTDALKISRPTTAALAGTTRTAAFCRPDIAERTLPILTTEFDDDRRRSDADMADEIRAQRNGLLSWAVATAAGLLARRRQAPEGLPLRFVDFARLVWAYTATHQCGTSAAQALLSLRQAQALTVGEADPLVEAIVSYIDKVSNDDGVWQGSASQLVKTLSDAGAEIPYMGGGKVISRHLREAKRTLEVMDVRLSERQWNNTRLFILQHDLTDPLPGFAGEDDESKDQADDEPRDHKFSDPTIGDDDIIF